MPASIGVNLRVTGHSKQGGRRYMEDYFSVAYQQTDDERDLEYAYFGIFDGHGGCEAATYAKDHLMEAIVREREFWSDKDEDVLKAIREGFINTHMAMWKEQDKWPKTASGLPSTAGTTASVAFIRRGKIYTGHVGDSGIVLGFKRPGNSAWEARRLTRDHKPESRAELTRIEQSGGKVVSKSGVPRVVWYRPQISHKGPVTRSTPFDEIPFLAVARSLGDLWSYNSANNEFVVSPEPDTNVIPIDLNTFRCLIFGSDGLWNMISPATAVNLVQAAEQNNAMSVLTNNPWINPSMNLVERALERWTNTRMRADNTTVVTLMLDPPGPPRAQVILQAQRMLAEPPVVQSPATSPSDQQEQQQHHHHHHHYNNQHLNGQHHNNQHHRQSSRPTGAGDSPRRAPYPANGLQILTRYDEPAERLRHSPSSAASYTEEYLDRVHRELYDSLSDSASDCSFGDSNTRSENSVNAPETTAVEDVNTTLPDCKPESTIMEDIELPVVPDPIKKTIQINVVSSSSDSDKSPVNTLTRTSRRRLGPSSSITPSELDESINKTRFTRSRSLGPEIQEATPSSRNRSQARRCDSVELAPTRVTRSRSLGPIEQTEIPSTPSRMTRSRSLGPIEQTDIREPATPLRNRSKPKKQENTKVTRSSSLGPERKEIPSVRSRGKPKKHDMSCESSRVTRSSSLGPVLHQEATPPIKNRGRPKKRERSISSERIPPRVTRSRSLGPIEPLTSPDTRQVRVPAKPKKRERSISSERIPPRVTRSRSLGPIEQAATSPDSREMRVRSRPKKRERSDSTEEQLTPNSASKRRGRPRKRERNESDEENATGPPQFKRSRSLGPEPPQTVVAERNLRERNVQQSTRQVKRRGSSVSEADRLVQTRGRRSK